MKNELPIMKVNKQICEGITDSFNLTRIKDAVFQDKIEQKLRNLFREISELENKNDYFMILEFRIVNKETMNETIIKRNY